jgi:hypothetical protein
MHEPSVLELIHEWLKEHRGYLSIRTCEDPAQMDMSCPLMGIIRINDPKAISIYVYPEHVELMRHIIVDMSMTNPGPSKLRVFLADPKFFDKMDDWLGLNLVI